MIINGQLIAKGIDIFFQHFKLIATKTCQYVLIFADNPIIAEDNRLAIQYKIDMYEQQQITMHTIVFFTFRHGKIDQWNQVISMMSATDMQLT